MFKELKDYKKYFDILEISPASTFFEVKSAYVHLKKLYSNKPLVLSPLVDEISETNQEEIVSNIEEAYEKLREYFSSEEIKTKKTSQKRVANQNVPEFDVFSGNALKLIREVLGIELEELSLITGIAINHLKNIELENFNLLPPKGYIKLFLKNYANLIYLDLKNVINDYVKIID